MPLFKAPAKINIGLYIGSRRSDGCHSIQTFMQTVDLCDEIEIEESDVFQFSAHGYDFPPGQENLCVKAYRLMSSLAGIDRPLSIVLRKKIPVFAGLGGGSSDAAAVIKGLNQLWGIDMDIEEQMKIGAKIGSDVPFFLAAHDGAAFCEGRGELVTPMEPIWKGWAVVLFFGLEISTAKTYKIFDENLTKRKNFFNLRNYLLQDIPRRKGLGEISNDFTEIIFGQHPELRETSLSLINSGAAYSSITGSGSAVFGLFGSENDAKQVCGFMPSCFFKIAASTPAPFYR